MFLYEYKKIYCQINRQILLHNKTSDFTNVAATIGAYQITCNWKLEQF